VFRFEEEDEVDKVVAAVVVAAVVEDEEVVVVVVVEEELFDGPQEEIESFEFAVVEVEFALVKSIFAENAIFCFL